MNDWVGRPTMVFHVPFALDPESTSASGIRPVRMRAAFEEIGCRVLEVSGIPAQRRRGARVVREHLRRGGRIDFAYSEAATLPTLLTTPTHWPSHPLLDLGLLRDLARAGVPVGLFYRDVYWRFPEYRQRVGAALATATTVLYRLDLEVYRRTLTRLYVPSMRMAEHVPIVRRDQLAALPPGCEPVEHHHRGKGGELRLVYVGGLNDHYRMHHLIEAVADTDGVDLDLCTRRNDWQTVREEYEPLLGGHTRIIHDSGSGLTPLYDAADVAALVVEPEPYREFAVPFKLFEYIGRGIPIIASRGTLAAEIVESERLGWVVADEVGAISRLLAHLRDHPEDVIARTKQVRFTARGNTWAARAAQVLCDLHRQ